jgi:dephospho-CoA kinase
MGKSAAEKILLSRDICVLDTDVLARQLVEPGAPALEEIKAWLGEPVVSSSGQLRRDLLAEIVFSDPAALHRLQAILHPRIRNLWKEQAELWRSQMKPVAVIVIPLLFETNAEAEFESVICVACSAGTQRERLTDRGWDNKQIEQRIAAQWPIERKMMAADHVVWTEGSMETTVEQLERIIF